tara:strand:+ start:532 stop:2355 length:1824 start_codon:yes stop_codon:yes gene_type:complete
MINNPMQQIERTMDAYAGNPEGLQKRANMSQELIDLLAMQKMKSDLAAAKRNMAMQQQGNPQTVKDQLQQGLMGEYRQEAAKDLGVNPSEGDVVERAGIAGQQMAQNAQMPQGPQGPQGGGGIASQTGPVNLAGGGIVAFKEGSEDEGAVEADALGQFLLSNSIDPEKAEKMRQIMEGIQKNKEEVKSKKRRGGAGLAEFRRSQGFDTSTDDPSVTPPASGIASPNLYPPKADSFAPTNEEVAKREELKKQTIINQAVEAKEVEAKEAEAAAASQGIATPSLIDQQRDIVTKMGELKVPEFTPDSRLSDAIAENLAIDPEQRAASRAAAIKEDLDLEGGIAALQARRTAAEDRYEERQESKTSKAGPLMAQLIGMSSGRVGSGAKARMAYNEKQEVLRDKYETELTNLDVKVIELKRSVGATAASAYDAAYKANMATKAGAMGALANVDESKRKSIVAGINQQANSLQAQQSFLQSQSQESRANQANILAIKQIDSRNAQTVTNIAHGEITKLSKQITDYKTSLLESNGELGTLTRKTSKSEKDQIRIDEIKREIDLEVVANTATASKRIQSLEAQLTKSLEVMGLNPIDANSDVGQDINAVTADGT